MISSLTELPAAGAYLNRVGAEPVHFKLAVVKKMVNGYPKVLGRAKFLDDGNIRCWGSIEKPTPEEAAAIIEEFATAEFPKIISIAAISDPPPDCNLNDPNVFVCHDFDENVIMVHQRYENKDGSKGFLPWTKWSDGRWRLMEPDIMPFYGLPGAKEHSTLFLHEGSKAARRVREMISGEREAGGFPWLEEMRWGAHIGWIGGVHAIERSDWKKLAAMGWRRVVIVADHDSGGRAIVPDIAEHFLCPTFTLVFDDHWPERFDLGDEWPDDLFGEEGQYIGPTYQQCLQPATWATDELLMFVGEPPKPKTYWEIRDNFADQWVWVSKHDLMVNIEMPHYRTKSGEFNGFIRPFSHVKDTLSLFQKRYTGNQMELTYDPSIEGTIVRTSSGVQAINLFQPSPIRPAPGDWTPWVQFLEHMFPVEEDRAKIARWAATLVARPGTRMLYGLLLTSETQGVGKGTFARILAELVGVHNASFPNATMIVDSQFNGWVDGKRLICVDEIYEGHSWKAYNKLKPFVTDDKIEVNAKHEKTWSMPNWTHYILMSNSRAALKIENTDRRWLVPDVTEDVWSEEEFKAFYKWARTGGLATIAMWAKTFEERKEGRFVRAGETAPMTESKANLINESRSEAEMLLDDLGEAIRERGEPTAVTLASIKEWLNAELKERYFETPQAMTRILRKAGLHIPRFNDGQDKRIKLGGARHTVIFNEAAMMKWEPLKIRSALVSPSDIMRDPM